jgi:hypothetical protein
MGFKSMPWELYYKSSLGEFVIRQRHTVHKSERVKAVNDVLKKYKVSPGASLVALQTSPGHLVYIYRNGQAIAHVASDIKAFKAALSDQLRAAFDEEERRGMTILKRHPVQETRGARVPTPPMPLAPA